MTLPPGPFGPQAMFRVLLYTLCLLPHAIFAHGSEFLGAKLVVLPSRELRLELTADYGENPMIANRDEAQEALTHNLTLELGGVKRPISELAKLAWEERNQPDLSSPLPSDTSGKPHQLLAAIWKWTPPPDVESLRFHVPQAVNHSTIFWLEEPGVEREKKKWSMLLGGDSTPPVSLPKTKHSWWWVVILAIICAAVAFFFLHRHRTLPA